MKVLLDTNVLVRVSQASDPLHPITSAAVLELMKRGYETCICNQNVFEFWVVVTRPIAVNGFGLSPADARLEADLRIVAHTVLPDPPALREDWLDLCERHLVSGAKAHDARLVALMLGHSLTHILTLNAADFSRYTKIQAVTPQDVMAGALPPLTSN